MAYQTIVLPASGTSFTQFQAGGIAAMIERLITVIAGITPTLAPSAAPTLSETGSGGTLPNGTYYAINEESNGIGFTTASAASTGQAITLGQNLVITPAALQTNNVSRRYFVSAVSNAGPWTMVAQGSTASTLTVSAPLPTNSSGISPQLTNTTALSVEKISELRSAGTGNLETTFQKLRQLTRNFNQGNPIAFDELQNKLMDTQLTFAALAQCCAEAGVLIDANPGTFGTVASLLNAPTPVRTWP